MDALPAVELLKKFVEPNSVWMDALPAVELLKKFVEPPSLKIDTLLPAVALLVKFDCSKVPGSISDSH